MYQIIDSLKICKDPIHGSYKLSLHTLKNSDCSRDYFSVTEWQCFRKRIVNHGFQIINESQPNWIIVRPNLKTRDGLVVFENENLRNTYSTPSKIKIAKDHGELIEIEPIFFKEYNEVLDSVNHEIIHTNSQ